MHDYTKTFSHKGECSVCGSSNNLVYYLNEELNESGEPLKLSVNTLDQALMEAASSYPHDKPLMNYFLPCWKRAVKASLQFKGTEGPKFEVHEEAKRLCMSGCLFALTMPDLYG